MMIWKSFKCYFRHKKNGMNIQELVVRLRIEEVNYGSEEMFYYVCGYYNCDKIDHNKNHKANVGDIVI